MSCRIVESLPNPLTKKVTQGQLYLLIYSRNKHAAMEQRVDIKEEEKMHFKGSVSQDFQSLFIHYSNPSGPMINRLKSILEFLFDFADILEFLRNSAVCITKRKKIKYNSKTL